MKYTIPTLVTDRLILKKGTLKDYLKVYEYDFSYLKGIDGIYEYKKTNPKDIEEFIDVPNCIDFIVYLKDTGVAIANICLDRYDSINKSLEITVNEHPNYWKSGYMSEALNKIIDYVFNNLDIDCLIYSYISGNLNSKALSEKLGFEYSDKYNFHLKKLNKDVEMIKTILKRH